MGHDDQAGRLEKIWIKRFFRGPMDEKESAELVVGRGLEGNANQGGKRQVTLLDRNAWEEMTSEMGVEVDPSQRRANLLVSGISLRKTRGRILRIGKSRLRIAGETRPCERMDEAWTGLREAMKPNWRGGVYGEVLAGDRIRVGDRVGWEENGSVA